MTHDPLRRLIAAAFFGAVLVHVPHPPGSLAPALAQSVTAAAATAPAAAPAAPQPYALEADVSMRHIRVDIAFSGARLVIFGSVNAVSGAAIDPRNLDIVAVIEGARSELTVRRKSRIFGLWLNAESARFAAAPKYYAIASTRPIAEIAPKALLADLGLGLDDVPITAAAAPGNAGSSPAEDEFKTAAVALGVREKHYVRFDRAVNFVGSSLFRGEVDLPANIPVGDLDVRVYLFGSHALLARHDSHLQLEREGFENFIYAFARHNPFVYGVATVIMAAGIGLLASFLAGRRLR